MTFDYAPDMLRTRWCRNIPAGVPQHVINRGDRKSVIFHQTVDRIDFLELLAEAADHAPVKLGAFSLMDTHFHLVLRPEDDRALSAYMQWLMNAHIRLTRRRYGERGTGHIYQGRYKNVPLPTEQDLFRVTRYVEANARAARLVERAEEWPWCSLARMTTLSDRPLVCPDVFPRPPGWLDVVNADLSPEELRILSGAFARGIAPSDVELRGLGTKRGRPRKYVAATN